MQCWREDMKPIENRNTQSVVDANAFFLELASHCDHPVAQLHGRRRSASIVNDREYIACEMRKAGFSYPLIGHVMNRDHKSIYNLVNIRAKK